MTLARHLAEVERAVRTVKPHRSALDPSAYIGGGISRLEYVGLRVPQVRAVSRTRFSFLDESESEILKVWDYVWKKSTCYETMCLPIEYYSTKKQHPRLAEVFPKIRGWAVRLDNWAHSDGLSSLYARALEQDRAGVLPTLEEWSESKLPWLRRQSLVSLLYYSRARTSVLPFKKLAAMVERQIAFDHYYVQKGVGWTLREMGNVYPEETLRFLEARVEKISAAAFGAATEKLPKAVKERLKQRRRG